MEFLKARLDEDERIAHAFSSDPTPLTPEDIAIYAPNLGIEARTHFARHDPARVLRQVEAGRRLIEESEAAYASLRKGPDPSKSWTAGNRAMSAAVVRNEAMRVALRIAALAYADHPDYRPEWKP